MKNFHGVLASVAIAVAAMAAAAPTAVADSPTKSASFAAAVAARPDVTIVVTDSGLGGLSVVADLAARLPASGIARTARIVFVNALLDDAIGYNDIPKVADKVRVFDAALAAMESRYQPDLILIACNTLSVFYDQTEHARQAATQAVSIVPMGVSLIEQALAETPGATAVVFGTQGTIDAGTHKRLLLAGGVADARVVGQACPRLTGAIERDAGSEETASRIQAFVEEAVARLPAKKGPLVASLNCTHFGYAGPLWEKAFERLGYPGVKVVDPNPLMTDLVLREGGARRFPETKVTVEVVSKTPITPDVQAALGGLLRTTSPATADALQSYTRVPDLFHVELDLR